MRKFILSAAIAAASLTAAPASAQVWRVRPAVQAQIRTDIGQLQNQIQRAQQRRTISAREAIGLRRQAVTLRQTLASYSRNGLSRAEVTTLELRVNQVRQNLRLERRDWDGRRG